MRRPSILRVCSVLSAVAIGAVAFVGLTHGYGADSGRAALAIRRAENIGFSATYRLVTECSDHVTVEVTTDPAGSGLPQVTVWGRPRVGRCQGAAFVNSFELQRFAADGGRVPLTKIVDGATSQVVDLSP